MVQTLLKGTPEPKNPPEKAEPKNNMFPDVPLFGKMEHLSGQKWNIYLQ